MEGQQINIQHIEGEGAHLPAFMPGLLQTSKPQIAADFYLFISAALDAQNRESYLGLFSPAKIPISV